MLKRNKYIAEAYAEPDDTYISLEDFLRIMDNDM